MEKELLLWLLLYSNSRKSGLFQHSHFSEAPGTGPSRADAMRLLDGGALEFLWPRDGECSTREENRHRWTLKLSLIMEFQLIS